MSEISIRDVARVAGVSISAVSLAYHKPGQLSEKTRKKILDVAQELGYHSNSKKLNKLRTIVLAIPTSSRNVEFSMRFSYQLFCELSEDGHQVLFLNYDSVDSLYKNLKTLRSRTQIHGMIVLFNEVGFEPKEVNIPVIVVSANNYQDKYINIGCNFIQEFQTHIRGYLTEGKKKIATLVPQALFKTEYATNIKQLLIDFYASVTGEAYLSEFICILDGSNTDVKKVKKFNDTHSPDIWFVSGHYPLMCLQEGVKSARGIVILDEGSFISHVIDNKFVILERPVFQMVKTAVSEILGMIEKEQNLSKEQILFPTKTNF